LWFTSPWKTLRFVIWRNFKWAIILGIVIFKKSNTKTNFGSSSGCGASRAFPTGFFSASSAVTSDNSASNFPFKNKQSLATNLSIQSRIKENSINPINKNKNKTNQISLTGEGNFNWRFVFDFDYLDIEEKVIFEAKDSVFQVGNTKKKIPPRLIVRVYDADFFSADDFLGESIITLTHVPLGGKLSKKCKADILLNPKHKGINLFVHKRIAGMDI
ncbi:unnamed protein product, partial [Rotaria sp. Silwood2]